MRTPLEVFTDYSGRRSGLILALTTDADKLFAQADPTKDNLCLYGYPDGSWAVDTPPEEVPAEVPEPALGINFARDGMQRQDWLGLVAVHSDAWLMALAFYKGARLDKEERDELFSYINKHPTVFEVVSGRVPPSGPARGLPRPKPQAREVVEDEDGGDEDDYEDGDGDPCPQCGKLYSTNEFWIACDFCDTWYCGRCAKMTEVKAQKVKNWKCTGCSGGA